MRIAVSDYDDTLRLQGREMDPRNADAIRRWRERGNRFGVATGRDRHMILHELDAHGIDCDFLICLNGGLLYGKDGGLLKSRTLDDDLVSPLIRHEACLASKHCWMLGDWKSRLYAPNGGPGGDGGLFTILDHGTALAQTNVVMLSLSYPDMEEGERWVKRMNDDFGGRILARQNTRYTDINHPDVNKAAAIAETLEILGWTGKEVFSIGDGGNDIEMIERFTGFAVPNAAPEVKAAANRVYDSVADMLEDL